MPSNFEFFPSGSTLLDCILGGGYALGQSINFNGLHSTGKTAFALEAAANFQRKYPKGQVFFADGEGRLDLGRLDVLGVIEERFHPLRREEKTDKYKVYDQDVDPATDIDAFTVEDLETTFVGCLNAKPADEECLYILDSVDSIPTKVELETTSQEQGGYKMEKAKLMNAFFRKVANRLPKARTTFIYISQLHDNVDPRSPVKYRKSGGRGLDFYATQMIKFNRINDIEKTVKGTKQDIGVNLKATCEKSSVCAPGKNCTFPFIFEYGVDDLTSCLDFLQANEGLALLPADLIMTIDAKTKKEKPLERMANVIERIEKLDKVDRKKAIKVIQNKTVEVWNEIQKGFGQNRGGKYD